MKFFKRLLLIAVCIVTLVTLFYSWTNWWGARKLSAALAMLRDKNEPTRFEEFVPPPVPDADNVAAAPVFQEFFASAKDSRLGKLDWPGRGKAGKLARVAGETQIHFEARSIDPDFQGDDQTAGQMVSTSLVPLTPLLEEVAEAVRRPRVCWPIDYSKGLSITLDHLPMMLKLSQVFNRRAIAELAAGRPDRAIEDIQTLFALARLTGSDRIMMSKLVENSALRITLGSIIYGLEHHAWTDSQLAELLKNLSLFQLWDWFDSYRIERAVFLQSGVMKDKRHFEKSFSSRTPTGTNSFRVDEPSEIASAAIAAVWPLIPAGWINESKTEYIEIIQRILDAEKTPNKLPSTITDIERTLSNISVWRKIRLPISFTFIEANSGFSKNTMWTWTILQSVAAACAIERYRMAYGRLPATLEDLVPAFLPSIPTDPLTGKPLCYKPSESSSYLIYGTGWDQTDNAGSSLAPFRSMKKFADQADWGVLVKF